MMPLVPKITIGEVAYATYAKSEQTGKNYRECWKEAAKQKLKADLIVFVPAILLGMLVLTLL